jgi:hypothetical protein
MAFLSGIDEYLRLIIIILFFVFFAYLLVHASKSKDLPTKRNFTFMFALFFLFTGLNFLFTEIDIRAEGTIYPEIIPPSFRVQLGFTFSPINSDFFLILFFLLAAVPMLYAFEKNILQQERFIVTYMGVVCLAMLLLAIPWYNYYLLAAGVVYSWVCLIVISLRIVFIYLKLAIKGVGEIRTMAMIIGVGFFLILIGTIFTNWESLFGPKSEIVGHSVTLAGVLCEFFGVLKMK